MDDSVVINFKELPTTCISDAMNGLNTLSPSIRPLNEHDKIIGRAFTVKIPIGDNFFVLKAISEAKPGDILVIDAKGDRSRAIAGDFVVGMAKTLALGGIVVDGVIRDVTGIRALDFPVFCKGTTIAASGKYGVGELNVAISCGGASIHPGDIIVGDSDGVIVIPKIKEQEVLKRAQDKLVKDEERSNRILGNPDAVRKYLNQVLSKAN